MLEFKKYLSVHPSKNVMKCNVGGGRSSELRIMLTSVSMAKSDSQTIIIPAESGQNHNLT